MKYYITIFTWDGWNRDWEWIMNGTIKRNLDNNWCIIINNGIIVNVTYLRILGATWWTNGMTVYEENVK